VVDRFAEELAVGGAGGLDGDDVCPGSRSRKYRAIPISVPAGAAAGDDGADRAVERLVDLGGRGLVVSLGVERVRELLWNGRVVELRGDLVGPVDGEPHPVFARRVHHLGAERAHQLLFLHREALRDHEDGVQAELLRRDRQPDSGVAGGRLDDCPAGADVPAFEHPFEHVLPDAVFDARAGIERLELRVHGRRVRRVLHPDERGLPHRL